MQQSRISCAKHVTMSDFDDCVVENRPTHAARCSGLNPGILRAPLTVYLQCVAAAQVHNSTYAAWSGSSHPPHLVIVCLAGIGGIPEERGGEEAPGWEDGDLGVVARQRAPWCLVAGTCTEVTVFVSGWLQAGRTGQEIRPGLGRNTAGVGMGKERSTRWDDVMRCDGSFHVLGSEMSEDESD
jgi:hypothetical protein